MGGNAFLLSIIYLVVGIGVEVARRFYPTRFVHQLSLSLDSLPARALEFVGALEPLRAAYLDGRVSDAQVRLLFGSTTIVVIFILAFVVGILVGGLRSYVERRAIRKASDRGHG
ncbi:hypothetical protein POL68_38110 [Stigmatella sp. ncwal1]|uniref:YggT family protein n=1 Tax=Stigmatella ashevillensis TaxID=2995309 RepID=A0ABT5DPM6_9BACT|nr:hypothetical protein [Stigmatella ashevillena]MDC0714332.1 hypothetical protein [Stigmatella ashevillena]